MERNNGERNVYFGQCCREVVRYFDGGEERRQIDERRGEGACGIAAISSGS